ncbi:metal ABC transporter solute-binding protein, Zn/Mn family, partial [Escherichia coli]|uniref:metal ABC transporter solute-binding protein, Zn/Mn family n=1 Tax=Escherichia coli TaxID=562 RepID=UPI00165E6BF7
VSSGVTPVGITEGPYEGKPNPHAWMSPDNALIYVDNIRDALIKYDPANAQTYQRNADTYKAKITQTLAPLRKQITELPENQRQVARETGAHYGGVLYVDSLSTENGPVPTYIDLLKVTTSTLVQGIKAGKREK